MITDARMEELFELVDKELGKIRKSRKLPGGAVLVGGTAKLPGIAEYAKEKLQLPARVGKLQNIGGLVDTVEGTDFCTVVGLMLLDMLLLPSLPSSQQSMQQGTMGLVGGLLKRFRK
jgi:cell division protein FtsA